MATCCATGPVIKEMQPMNSTGSIRKMMGWCPLKKIDSIVDYAVSQGYALSGNAPVNDKPIRNMDIPVQSIYEWRILAILLAFITLILIGSQRAGTFRYVLPPFFVYILLVFILSRTKLSVGGGTLRISIPFSRTVIIPKNSITSMEIIENIARKHKLRNLAGLILIFMMLVFLAYTLEGPIWTNLFMISTFLFVYTLYFSFRIYNNTKIIKINADGREILLYPRNESEFFILKSIAPSRLDQ